jgi:MerR family mercuric resistance operon transcriptional regulator
MLTRGKLSEQSGCNPETIRYYERVGLLPEPPRSESGYRMYDDSHVSRLRFIQRARELGFSAERVRDLLSLSDNPEEHTRAEVKQLTEAHIQEIRKKIVDLQRLKKRLNAISSHCDGAMESTSECPILISLFSEQ